MVTEVILPKSDHRSLTRLVAFLSGLSPHVAWRVTIEHYARKRSDPQNRYLNGACYKIIGDAIGYERDEVSEFLCGTYFGWKDKKVPKKPSNPRGIESVPVRTTTTDENGKRAVLNKQEFADYVAFVQRFAASKGVYIPEPDEHYSASEAA